MLASAATAGWIDYLIAPLAVLLVLAIARAASQTWGKNKNQGEDIESISDFLFDQPANDRTKAPAKKGWATEVNEKLKSLDDGQVEILKTVKSVGSKIIEKQEKDSPS